MSMRVSPATHMIAPPAWRSVMSDGPQVRWMVRYAGNSSLVADAKVRPVKVSTGTASAR